MSLSRAHLLSKHIVHSWCLRPCCSELACIWRSGRQRRLSTSADGAATELHLMRMSLRSIESQEDLKVEAVSAPLSGKEYGDSPQALRALELFSQVSSPAASGIVNVFLQNRRTLPPFRTLDEFLLDELHRPDNASGVFVKEWKKFAHEAAVQDRSNVATKAWSQWRAFGGSDTANALEPLLAGGSAAECVTSSGVVRVPAVLSEETAAKLRAFVLAERDACLLCALPDSTRGAEVFSRVLSPTDVDSLETTRWDIRLPWEAAVKDAVLELLSGVLGEAFSELCGGDDAELWECASVVSAAGAAPQILHADTIFSLQPAVFTAFVALQDIHRHQGPTRFVKNTHSGLVGESAHNALQSATNGVAFCEGATSRLALLSAGEAALYDSRLLHSGGPHMDAQEKSEDLFMDTERVLFYVSFLHLEADLDNTDIHGAGSIRKELAARRLRLGQLRTTQPVVEEGDAKVHSRRVNRAQ